MIRARSAFTGWSEVAPELRGRPPRGLDTAREIYDLLRERPGLSSHQVSQALGRAATGSFVVSYVEALDALGLMVYCETGPDDKTRWYAV